MNFLFKTIRDVPHIQGVTVLLRLDLNVPVAHGVVVDNVRIRKALPTLNYLTQRGARVIIVSHIENNVTSKNSHEAAPSPSLLPVAEELKKMGVHVQFVEHYRQALSAARALADGEVMLLENVRMNAGEKTNDKAFAKELASLADIYVNDAFSVSHREHASVCAITTFLPSYAGLLFTDEVKNLSSAFRSQHPFLFIIGGAKFDTKLPLIEKFSTLADTVFVGGALAHNFFKELGYEIGDSLVSPEKFGLSKLMESGKIMLPLDVVVVREGEKVVVPVTEIRPGDAIMDSGPATIAQLRKKIFSARYILWNGPLGAYEQGFTAPTKEVAESVAMSGAMSVVGGGDTLAAIAQLDNADKFSFVSTSGGAMLDFLSSESLPGIKALEAAAKSV
jgi:phosphoglycerate kinase